jgi:hypothetical protein
MSTGRSAGGFCVRVQTRSSASLPPGDNLGRTGRSRLGREGRSIVHEFSGNSETSATEAGSSKGSLIGTSELVRFPILPNSGTSVAKANSEGESLTQRWKRCSTQNHVFPRPVGRLKPRSSEGALYAALKRRSSTVSHGSVRTPCKIKIKSSGQECPLHTSRADAARVDLRASRFLPVFSWFRRWRQAQMGL